MYLVDTKLPGGSGPIRVKPGVKSAYEFLQDAPMVEGDKYSYENIEVEVLKSNENSDEVKVTVKPN